MNLHEIGSRIREQRKALRVTQRDLAAISGIGINTINKIEQGTANPTLSILLKLLDTLGLKVEVTHKESGEQ